MRPPAAAAWTCISSYGCMDVTLQLRLQENASLCSYGPIFFALVIISQWHIELRRSLRFLRGLEATITFPSRKGTRDSMGALVTTKVTNPPGQYGVAGGPARDPAQQRRKQPQLAAKGAAGRGIRHPCAIVSGILTGMASTLPCRIRAQLSAKRSSA